MNKYEKDLYDLVYFGRAWSLKRRPLLISTNEFLIRKKYLLLDLTIATHMKSLLS